jgi:hypothetical protein
VVHISCCFRLFGCRLILQCPAGTSYTQQSYKVSDSFPFKWINKKWREGFYVTSMATAGSRWGVVMSRNAGFSDQVSEAAELAALSGRFDARKKMMIGAHADIGRLLYI